MPFKEGCGFREKVNVCKFREEDCNAKDCDMYNINFTSKAINKQAKIERKAIIKLTKEMEEMKKNKEYKKNDEYKKRKELRKDKVIGMIKLSKAYTYCKRIKI